MVSFDQFTSCVETIGSNLSVFGGNIFQALQFIGKHVAPILVSFVACLGACQC